MIDGDAGGRRIAARGETDAPFDEVLEAGVGPRALVVPPGRVEDAAGPLRAHPGPGLVVIPLDPLLEHRPAAVVVLRVHVRLVPALEAAEALHHRVAGSEDRRAKLPRAVLLELRPHEVHPGGRIAEAVARAVQRHEPLAPTDELEDRGLPLRRQHVDVGVDGERVVGREGGRREVGDVLGVHEFDAPGPEHRLELREAVGRPVVPLVAEEEHADRLLRRGGGRAGPARGGAEAGDEQAGEQGGGDAADESGHVHDEKLHSGSFLITPPCIADSWARMPVQVQLALWRALG